jgi:hypothetical protein
MMEHPVRLPPAAGMIPVSSLVPCLSSRLWQRLLLWMNYSSRTRESPPHHCSRKSLRCRRLWSFQPENRWPSSNLVYAIEVFGVCTSDTGYINGNIQIVLHNINCANGRQGNFLN